MSPSRLKTIVRLSSNAVMVAQAAKKVHKTITTKNHVPAAERAEGAPATENNKAPGLSLSGAITGATLGRLAGAPGMVAGGVIGACAPRWKAKFKKNGSKPQ